MVNATPLRTLGNRAVVTACDVTEIAARAGTASIWYDPNDLTSHTKPRGVVYVDGDEWADAPGDVVDLRLSKTFMECKSGEEYISGINNRINNGGFDSDAGWTLQLGATIEGGTLNFNGGGRCERLLDDTSGMVQGGLGDFFRVKFTVTSYTSGTLTVRGGSGQPDRSVPAGTGTFVLWDVADTLAGVFFRGDVNSFIGSVDDVEVKFVPGPVAFSEVGQDNLLVFDATRNLYGVQWGSASRWAFRQQPTDPNMNNFDYWILRDLDASTRGIFVSNLGTNWFDIWEQGVNSSIVDSGATLGGLTINGTTMPDSRDAVYTAGAVGTTIWHYRDMDYDAIIPGSQLTIGNGYTPGGFDPSPSIDYGMLFRWSDVDQITQEDRNVINTWYGRKVGGI